MSKLSELGYIGFATIIVICPMVAFLVTIVLFEGILDLKDRWEDWLDA